MFRFFTGLHKVWANKLSIEINMLKNQITIPDTYPPLAPFKGRGGDKTTAGRTKPSFFSSGSTGAFSFRTLPLLFLAFFLTLHPLRVSAEPLSAGELTSKIQSAYDGMKDLKADFIQEIVIKSMKKTEREAGVVWIKYPGKMVWDYTNPKVKKLVINEKTTWLYVDEDKVAYIQKTDAAHHSKLAVKFLAGMGQFSEDFLVEYARKERVDAEGNYLLKLTAREQGSIPDKIELTIDRKFFHILACRFNDGYGNTTSLRFSNIRINAGISDSFFTFRPAPDVEITDMP